MRADELEVWVRRVLRDVEAGRTVEESRVELKSRFMDPVKAAHQLAGLANSARTQHVLWIVGADDRRGVVEGVDNGELESWLPQVEKVFDELAPRLLLSHRVPWGDSAVVTALLFDASARPFVTKDEGRRLVKWRRGDHTREARRGDLLDLLYEAVNTPSFEIIEARLTGYLDWDSPSLRLKMELYQERRLPQPAILPFHRASVEAQPSLEVGNKGASKFADLEIRRQLQAEVPHSFSLRPEARSSPPSRYVAAEQLELDGPARVSLVAHAPAPPWLAENRDRVDWWDVEVKLPVIDAAPAEVRVRVAGENPLPEPRKEGGDEPPKRPAVWVSSPSLEGVGL